MVSKRRPLFALLAIVAFCCCILPGCASTSPAQMTSLSHQFNPDHDYHDYRTPSIQIQIAPEFQLTPDMQLLPEIDDNPDFHQHQPRQHAQPKLMPAFYYSDRDPTLPSEPVQTILVGNRAYARGTCTSNSYGQRQTLRYRWRVRSVGRGGTCCRI